VDGEQVIEVAQNHQRSRRAVAEPLYLLIPAPLSGQAVAWLLRALSEAGASGAVTALATRAAAQVSLDDPQAVASLLEELHEAGATDAVFALLARDPAAHISPDNPYAVGMLLRALRAAGPSEASDAVRTLAAWLRPPTSHSSIIRLIENRSTMPSTGTIDHGELTIHEASAKVHCRSPQPAFPSPVIPAGTGPSGFSLSFAPGRTRPCHARQGGDGLLGTARITSLA
jgi:hypothetical protein